LNCLYCRGRGGEREGGTKEGKKRERGRENMRKMFKRLGEKMFVVFFEV
jgi:hypothetical protein